MQGEYGGTLKYGRTEAYASVMSEQAALSSRTPSRPEVGASAPDFALPDPMTGQIVHLADSRGRDVLLVFFRGTWCPFCREQLRVLTENDARLKAAGIATVGVVCQSAGTVRRYLQSAPVPFPLLVDETRAVAKAYGVHYWLSLEGFNLANPSLFILDRAGNITFAHRGRNMRDLPVTDVLERFVALLGA